MEKIPQELFDKVAEYLSPESRLHAIEAGFKLPEQATRHSNAWRKVFRKFDWLEAAVWAGANPMLVGRKAGMLLDQTDDSIYLILLPMEFSSGLQYHFSSSKKEYEQAFLDTLQKYDQYDKELAEVHFRESNITVNISEIIRPINRQAHGSQHTKVKSIDDIFTQDGTTSVLFYMGIYKHETVQARIRRRKVYTYSRPEDLTGERWILKVLWVSFYGHRWYFSQMCPPDSWYLSDRYFWLEG